MEIKICHAKLKETTKNTKTKKPTTAKVQQKYLQSVIVMRPKQPELWTIPSNLPRTSPTTY